jgi:hypothetical protein
MDTDPLSSVGQAFIGMDNCLFLWFYTFVFVWNLAFGFWNFYCRYLHLFN